MKMKAVLFSVLFALGSAAAYASNGAWSGVTITEIIAYTSEGQTPNGMVYLLLSSNGTNNASCATTKNEVVIDTSTVNGAYVAQLAATARLSGQTVSLGGAGSCLVTGVETLGSISY